MTTCFIQSARQPVFDVDLESRRLAFRREPFLLLADIFLDR